MSECHYRILGNDAQDLLVIMVTGELTEKLQQVIEEQIIPQLKQSVLLASQPHKQDVPICTLVFDREAYAPAFFERLWQKYRIAMIIYRKKVRDQWGKPLLNHCCYSTRAIY